MLVKKHADMIIIADSGSTKTHWVAISDNGTRTDIISSGINPYYQSQENIASDIRDNVKFDTSGESVEVYFYGAGCANDEKKAIVRDAINANYPTAVCHVESDLTGACRSLLQHSDGIACILGTGSNSCYYDGKNIVKNVSPLGFIIGDEGSGAVIGKTFIGDLLKKQTTAEIEELFSKEYSYSAGDIVEAVYRKSFPNRFLAQFTKFIAHASENCHDEASIRYIDNLLVMSFRAFFIRNVSQYGGTSASFVGSVAHVFRKQLTQAAHDCGFTIGTIVQDPMEGLITYHTA